MTFQIITDNLTKSFSEQTLYSGLNLEFQSPQSYVILGPNGSGKSTLLQMLMGFSSPSEGKVNYILDGKVVDEESMYLYQSFAAPYIDLPEELTAAEVVNFHFTLRTKISEASTETILQQVGLYHAKNKSIKYFSSGMKQRLKLALACYTQSAALLLDEPCTNLDEEGIAIYHKLIQSLALNRLVIIASNQAEEYRFCTQKLVIGL